MRRLAALVLLVGGPLLLLARRREGRRESVSLYYGDGSMVTLERGAPGSERLLELARRAL
jgi:hypothetical protein